MWAELLMVQTKSYSLNVRRDAHGADEKLIGSMWTRVAHGTDEMLITQCVTELLMVQMKSLIT